jgi:hypothetical protein
MEINRFRDDGVRTGSNSARTRGKKIAHAGQEKLHGKIFSDINKTGNLSSR